MLLSWGDCIIISIFSRQHMIHRSFSRLLNSKRHFRFFPLCCCIKHGCLARWRHSPELLSSQGRRIVFFWPTCCVSFIAHTFLLIANGPMGLSTFASRVSTPFFRLILYVAKVSSTRCEIFLNHFKKGISLADGISSKFIFLCWTRNVFAPTKW